MVGDTDLGRWFGEETETTRSEVRLDRIVQGKTWVFRP